MIFSKRKPAPESSVQAVPLPKWEHAKLIAQQEGTSGNLPVGWYLWKDGYGYQGLKPNETNTDLVQSYHLYDTTKAREWLGVPLPPEILEEEEKKKQQTEELKKFLEGLQKEKSAPVPASPPIPEVVPVSAVSQPKTYQCKRPCETHIRFTESEFEQLRDRVEQSGLPQSIFLRQAALKGEILADTSREQRIAAIRETNLELRKLRGELGRLGGLLKMAIKPNEEQRSLDPAGWETLISTTKALFRTQEQVEKMMEKLDGRFDPEFQ